MKLRIRVDYNTLLDKISTLVEKSKSQYAKDYGDSILWGLSILSQRIKDIANIAIEKQYQDIIDQFIELGVIKETKGGTE